MTKRRPRIDVDQIIGQRIRELRNLHNISAQQLAEKVGISTFQLTKYETYTNSLSVGRLFLIAKALNVDINYFYQGLIKKTPSQDNSESIELAINFMKLKDPNQQRIVHELVKIYLALENQEKH